MKIRIISATVAVLLAIVGTVLLVSYVGGAEARAQAGAETIDVWVVETDIAEGTLASAMTESVTLQSVPAKVVPADAVKDLAELKGQVTTAKLLPGEQLLASRFADPEDLVDAATVQVPDGMQEVTVQLEPQRVVGGQLQPGDTVGVFISLGSADSDPPDAVTHLTLHKVLVTTIQGLSSETAAETTDTAETDVPNTDAPAAAPVPPGSVLVTVAVLAPDAEKIVFAQEFGLVWLSKEPLTASEDGTQLMTSEKVYK